MSIVMVVSKLLTNTFTTTLSSTFITNRWATLSLPSLLPVPNHSFFTPILFTIGSCRHCWMNGPIQSVWLQFQQRSCTTTIFPFFRKQQQNQYIPTASNTTNTAAKVVQRIQKNVARLYARRMLDIAIASAALQRYKQQQKTQLFGKNSNNKDETTMVVHRPKDWENWTKREFDQELYNEVGTNIVQRIWSATQRIISLSCLLLPYTVLVPMSYISTTMHNLSWKYTLWSIEQSGPTFIKLFQWATTRQDLFTPQFCQYFSQLQDNTVGHRLSETIKILQQDLLLPYPSQIQQERPPSQHTTNATSTTTAITKKTNASSQSSPIDVNEYITLDTKPIGSGCIAQVYHGILRKPIGQYTAGTEIAVKVQHPGIVHKVCVDFYIMNIVAHLLEAIPYLNLSFLSLVDTVHKFRDIMIPQLDLSIEAQHLQRFNRDFYSDPSVSFPKPIHELTSTRVLTETFIHGKPILQYVNASEADRKELALLGLNTTLKMIFINDFLHGDLHPGNILVSRDMSVSGHPLRLHLLDCGLVVEMGPEQHINLVKILGAFARRNGALAGQLMVDTSSDCQASPMDIELFVKGIEHIVVEDENNNFLEKVGDYITDICFLACQRKVKLEASFINAALAVEIMEGIASALYPDLKVTKVALPLVVQAELMHRLPKLSIW